LDALRSVVARPRPSGPIVGAADADEDN